MSHTLFYRITHFLLGGLSTKHKIIIPLFFIYQSLQLFLNVRYFILEDKCKKGNSVEHTTTKIFEFFLGFMFFQLFDSYIFEQIIRK